MTTTELFMKTPNWLKRGLMYVFVRMYTVRTQGYVSTMCTEYSFIRRRTTRCCAYRQILVYPVQKPMVEIDRILFVLLII